MAKNSRVLIISDLHAPFYHKDTIPFLTAIKELFDPDRVVLTGDEIDGHCISFHDKSPDIPFSPSSELEKAIEDLRPIYELFPKADVLESNHGSLVYRKGKFAGLPRSVFRDYRDILDAPKGWRWHNDLIIQLSDGQDVYCCHGRSSNGRGLSRSESMNTVQGHYHTSATIDYFTTKRGVFWSVIAGCMIDNESLAFEYNKTNLVEPVLSCVIILDGHPKILPMILDENKRWIRRIV